MANQRILVTGANGQLGKELQQQAASFPGYDFIFLSKDDLPVHEGDAVERVFDAYRPAYCINCAAYTAVDKAESEPGLAFLVNAEAPGILARVTETRQCRFIHVSTDYVFDGSASEPYREDSVTNPQSVYGASKLEGEKRVLQFNPGSIIVRTSWVYSVFGKNFVKTMLKLMNERDEVNVVSDQVGSPTHAADLAEAILVIIGQLPPPVSRLSTIDYRLPPPASVLPPPSSVLSPQGIFHYSNEGVLSWYDFAVAIKNISGSSCKVNPIPTTQYPTPAKRPAYSVLDKTKIKQVFGIQLKGWRQSLEDCISRIRKASAS